MDNDTLREWYPWWLLCVVGMYCDDVSLDGRLEEKESNRIGGFSFADSNEIFSNRVRRTLHQTRKLFTPKEENILLTLN